MLKKLYDKSQIWFSVAWIIAYCILMSVGDAISLAIGIEKSITLVIGILLSVSLIIFLKKNGLLEKYGICKSQVSLSQMLFYLPVILLLTANLWYGVSLNYTILETVLYILAMLCVGLLEEIIFRGLLFNAMKKDNLVVAIIVSSVTFGMGHIINLFNGSGAELFSNILQIIYATAAGFMFVMMYCKSGSLVICIAAHALFNALSAFSNEASQTQETEILVCLLLTVITGVYAIYLAITMNKTAQTRGTRNET